ncbi:MAG TPA: hypothetical protein VM580_24345 [Labilithrix sp.]|nr:hypothetical protein [Labilithrix sp.]
MQSATRDEEAELRRKQESERAETAAEGKIDTSEARTDVSHAHEKMAQDRRDFSTKSSERLAKLEARAQEMKAKSTQLTGTKKQNFDSNYTLYANQRDAAQANIKALPSVSDDDWQETKEDVEKKLDSLENSIDKMRKNL